MNSQVHAQWSGWPWVAAGAVGLAVAVGVGAVAGAQSAGGGGRAQPAVTITKTVEKIKTVEKTVTVEASAKTTTQNPKPTTRQAPRGPATTFGEGRWEVGVDVAAGKYKSRGGDGTHPMGCVWTRYAGDGESVVDIGYSDGPQTITVKAGELVEIAGCEPWKKS